MKIKFIYPNTGNPLGINIIMTIIFGPIKDITPENITDVFVHDFWSYSEQLKTFIPFGMTFEQIPRLNNQFVGFPNSEIELMSFAEYKVLLKKTKRNLALFVWSKINRSEDPIDVINNKNIYIYTDSISSFENLITGIVVPRSLTQPYDLSEGEQKNKNLEKILEYFENRYDEYMPKYTRALDVNFDQDNLFLTCCRFEKASKKLFDCNKLLLFELTFLEGLYIRLIFPGLDPLNIVAFSRRRLPNMVLKNPMPDCEKCSGYVVYCGGPYDGRIRPTRKEKGLSLIKMPKDGGNLDLLLENYNYFKNLKEANEYFDETLNNTQSKYLCLPKVQGAMGSDIEYECKELLEPCAIEYVNGNEDIVLYDSKEECEENCKNKYVAYCDKRAFLYEGKSAVLVIKAFVDIKSIEDIEDRDDVKIFDTLEEANVYKEEIIQRNESKWVCSTVSNDEIPDDEEKYDKCYEIVSYCSGVFDNVYDTEEQCEENCNKKWYCVEYECTKVDINSQLVEGLEGLEGYDSKDDCEQNCKIPDSSSSSSQSPYYEDIYE
jgi:hypothetical protein